MKSRKFFAAVLALLMLAPAVLSGCKQVDNESSASTNTIKQNVTLNMYVMTNEETDEEQAKAVQMAINEITLPEYKTMVKINYVTADEYWDTIDAAEIAANEYLEQKKAEAEAKKKAQKEANKAGNTAPKVDDGKVTEEEIEIVDKEFNDLIDKVFDENSTDITLEHDQLDIFFVDSPEKYFELIADDRIVSIDNYVTLENKILNSYIHPNFFVGAKAGKGLTYGIPVNKPIGEYEYFVFNKDLLAKYGYDAEALNTFEALGEYLQVIRSREPGIVPLTRAASIYGFDFYGDEGSALGTQKFDEDSSFPGFIVSLYEVNAFYKHFETIRSYKLAGYIPANYNGAPFAVDVRRGGYADMAALEEQGYECVVYKAPRATSENILDSVFVVSKASENPSRATEIIRHFNTNPELANLLQYGILGTHYYVDEKDEVTHVTIDGVYSMNNEQTGNLYIKYSEMGESHLIDSYKAQNLDSVPHAFLGFNPERLDIEDKLMIEKANAITKPYYPGLMAGLYDINSIKTEIKNKLAAIDITEELAAYYAANPEEFDETKEPEAYVFADAVSEIDDLYSRFSDMMNMYHPENYRTIEEESYLIDEEPVA